MTTALVRNDRILTNSKILSNRRNGSPRVVFPLPSNEVHGLEDRISGREIVTVMQSTQSRHRDDLAIGASSIFRLAAGRRSLRQREMSSILVVIADVFSHEVFQMALVDDDRMVEQIPPTVANPSVGNTVLPRTSEAGPLGLNAEALYGVDHLRIETGPAVENQVAGRRVIGERLAQLLNDPGAGRMSGNVAVKNAPPVMGNDEEAV